MSGKFNDNGDPIFPWGWSTIHWKTNKSIGRGTKKGMAHLCGDCMDIMIATGNITWSIKEMKSEVKSD